MDYRYIEQLLKQYWQCETTVEEEQILRSFFGQQDVPAHLAQYAPLFAAQKEAAAERMPLDFEARLQRALDRESVASSQAKPRHTRLRILRRRLSPMLQAAAIVAVCLTIGNAAEHALNSSPADSQAEDTPAVETTYMRSSQVAETLRPANQRSEATAVVTAPATVDSLAHSAIAPEGTTK